MAWSGERWMADPSPLLGHKAEARIPLSVLFLGCNLDATEKTNKRSFSFDPFKNNTIFTLCVDCNHHEEH